MTLPPSAEPTLSVAEVCRVVGGAITRALPDEIWVAGVIRDLNRVERTGTVYFNLVDPGAGDRPGQAPDAVLPVVLFSKHRNAINRMLIREGAGRMTDGIEVRIRGRIGLHAARGSVQLTMTWLDKDYTMGRLAAARERLLRALAAEGLLDRNASLPMPVVPLRVGVVTSVGSAAWHDFVEELTASGFGFDVSVWDTPVQGPAAADAVAAAITRAAVAGVDVVALVRGGGSATDLAAFDAEPVARAVALAPVPVIVGVGHEVDETIADRVAAYRAKTPTAAAAFLVQRVAAFSARVDATWHAIGIAAEGAITQAEARRILAARRASGLARARVGGSRIRVDELGRRTARAARGAVSAATHRLSAIPTRIVAGAGRSIRAADGAVASRRLRVRRAAQTGLRSQADRVVRAEAVVAALDPRRALARGWSIVRDRQGNVVRGVGGVESGDAVAIEVVDGTITATVSGMARRERTGPDPHGNMAPGGGAYDEETGDDG